jgi:hypothetical protein
MVFPWLRSWAFRQYVRGDIKNSRAYRVEADQQNRRVKGAEFEHGAPPLFLNSDKESASKIEGFVARHNRWSMRAFDLDQIPGLGTAGSPGSPPADSKNLYPRQIAGTLNGQTCFLKLH